jgi:hypothetical protein
VQLQAVFDRITEKVDEVNERARIARLRDPGNFRQLPYDLEIIALGQDRARRDLEECNWASAVGEYSRDDPFTPAQILECQARANSIWYLEFVAVFEELDWRTRRQSAERELQQLNSDNPDCESCDVPSFPSDTPGQTCPHPWEAFSGSSGG